MVDEMIFLYTWAMLAVGFFLGAAWSGLGRKNKDYYDAFNDSEDIQSV